MKTIITQKMEYKQSVVKFSCKYGVKNAAIKFNECEITIYRWRKRYLWFSNEHSTYESAKFVIKAFPFKVECVQTMDLSLQID